MNSRVMSQPMFTASITGEAYHDAIDSGFTSGVRIPSKCAMCELVIPSLFVNWLEQRRNRFPLANAICD